MTNSLPKAGEISIVSGYSPTSLKSHQTNAVRALSAKVEGRPSFAGLLVMPTGSGKTVTAVHWLLQNVINRQKKLLWIAHRHELLSQALRTFVNNSCGD